MKMTKAINRIVTNLRDLAGCITSPVVGALVTIIAYQMVLAVALLASLAAYCGEMLGDDSAPPDSGPDRYEVSDALHRATDDPQRLFRNLPVRPTTSQII
jgi:hypothetical protein